MMITDYSNFVHIFLAGSARGGVKETAVDSR